MFVIETNQNARFFEIDNELFDDVREFINQLAIKKKSSFSYIDELGDTIVVNNGKEYVVPTKDDLKNIYEPEEYIGDIYK